MDILFPPVLESQGLGFPFIQNDQHNSQYEIRFALPIGTNPDAIRHVQVSIKDLNTGVSAVSEILSPDKAVLYISTGSSYWVDEGDGNYCVRVPYRAFANGLPAKDTAYSFQVRFGSTGLWDGAGTGLEGNRASYSNFASWRLACTSAVPTTFGEWSNLMKAYCYGPFTFTTQISYADFMPTIGAIIKPSGDDAVEQIRVNYWYESLDGVQMDSNVFSGQLQKDNTYSFKTTLPLAPVKQIQGDIEIVTKNNVKMHKEFHTDSLLVSKIGIQEYDEIGIISDLKMSAPEQEDGVIGKRVTMPGNIHGCSFFNVYRIELLTTKCVKIISKQQFVSREEVTFKDYTCEMGEEYQYVAIATDDNGICKFYLNKLAPYGDTNPGYARLMRMDSTYLVSRAHQLRLQGNVSLSGLKRNTQDAFQTTIGSKYPFYSRASKMNYRSFSLSGVISINFDPTSSFLRLDAIGKIDKDRTLTYHQYEVLIDKSPGLTDFFKMEYDDNGLPVYKFNPSNQIIRIMNEDTALELVNRCASTLALNGLWWDDDNGKYSSLYLQDKDIIATEEMSLSRARFSQNSDVVGIETYKNDPDMIIEGHSIVTKYDEYLHRQTGLNYNTDKSDSMVYVERKFREKVMDWLSDGKPKLFRSETEGNMIVVLSGISFTPLDKTNRMVYSVSMTVTEVADLTSENLVKFNLIPSLIQSVYIDNDVYKYTWGSVDMAVTKRLTYKYYSNFEIPNLELKNEAGAVYIPTITGVLNDVGTLEFTDEITQKLLDGTTITQHTLPPGLTVTKTTKNGVPGGTIIGYPTGDNVLNPGFATLTVTDSTGAKASVSIPYGWMYEKMQPKNNPISIQSAQPGKDFIDVGEQILDIDLTEYFTGGVAPFSYFPQYGDNKSLPDGVSLDGITGIISGTYTNPISGGKSYVTVRDSIGKELDLELEYVDGKLPLSFVKLPTWDYGYLEVGVSLPVPYNDMSKGVSGGFLGEGAKYEFYLGDDAPSGITIGKFTGIISGTPLGISPPGAFTVTVKDSASAEKSIKINYNKILPTFIFDVPEGYQAHDIWIPAGESTNGHPNTLTLGTVIVGIDVKPFVSGGLQFTNGAPYRFSGIGLKPDWSISRDGIITGTARTAMAESVATLIAEDARGKKATYEIKIGAVENGIEFKPRGITISNLYVGESITDAHVSFDNGNGKVTLTSSMVTPENLPITMNMSNEAPGIILTQQNATTWLLHGAPIQAGPARTGWIDIGDNKDNSLRVQVRFKEVIAKLDWKDGREPQSSLFSGAPGAVLEQNFGMVGGLAGEEGFDVSITGDAKDYAQIIAGNPDDISTWKIKVTLPDEGLYNKKFLLTVKDAKNTTLTRLYTVKTSHTKIKATKLRDFVDVTVMRNHAVFNENVVNSAGVKTCQIIEIEGGAGPGSTINDGYFFVVSKTYVKRISISKMPGMFLEIQGKYIVLTGTPTSIVSSPVNLGENIIITDVDKTSTYEFAQMVTGPRVVEKPKYGPQIDENNTVIREDGLIYGSSYRSPYYFQNLQYSGIVITYTPENSLPKGISESYDNDKYYYLSGIADSLTPEDITIRFTLKTTATIYDEQISLTVTQVFGQISLGMDFYIDSVLTIPPLGVGVPMEDIIISEHLTNGTGPFEWNISGGPDGITIQKDATNSRIAYLTGTPTGKIDSGVITVYVTDTATGITLNSSISYAGVFEPLKLVDGKTLEIPEHNAEDELIPIQLGEYVEGGQPGYTYEDDSGLLFIRGYYITEDRIEGKASEFGYGEVEGIIKVKDVSGQTLNLPYKIGKINGAMYFDQTNPNIIVNVPGGEVGTIYTEETPENLFNIGPGVSGGTEPYIFAPDPIFGWEAYGFEVEMDATEGRATKIMLPLEPVVETPSPEEPEGGESETPEEPELNEDGNIIIAHAGQFFINVTDAEGRELSVKVNYGEVFKVPEEPTP